MSFATTGFSVRRLALAASLVGCAAPGLFFVSDAGAQLTRPAPTITPAKPPTVVPTLPTAKVAPPPPSNPMAVLFPNPTFEGDAMPWTSAGSSAPPRRECLTRTTVGSATLRQPNGQPIASVGGNYWKVPFETAPSVKGEEGVCFLRSGLGGSTASPAFRQSARWLSMRARSRAGGSTIRLVTTSNDELGVKPVPTGDRMGRVTFDLSMVPAAHKSNRSTSSSSRRARGRRSRSTT